MTALATARPGATMPRAVTSPPTNVRRLSLPTWRMEQKLIRLNAIVSVFQTKQQLIEDVVVGFENPVREPVVADELPDIFDWVQLG